MTAVITARRLLDLRRPAAPTPPAEIEAVLPARTFAVFVSRPRVTDPEQYADREAFLVALFADRERRRLALLHPEGFPGVEHERREWEAGEAARAAHIAAAREAYPARLAAYEQALAAYEAERAALVAELPDELRGNERADAETLCRGFVRRAMARRRLPK